MCRSVIGFIWPTSVKYSDPSLTQDLEEIKATTWTTNPEIFLEEARRLRDIESARKNTADTKCQIYLGVLLALVPIALTIGGLDFFSDTLSNLQVSSIIALGLLIFGIFYGLAASTYALKTLNVTAYNRVDVDELVQHAKSKKPIDEITKEILISVRRDRIPVNQKVGLVKLTQQHVARMAIMIFCGLSLLRIWPFMFDGMQFIWNNVCGS